MRIAYVAPYRGVELFRRRPSTNLALAANLKIELIAQLLARSGHDVEIISPGEAARNRMRFFPAFRETIAAAREIPVFYASALPMPFVNGFWSGHGVKAIFERRHKQQPFDAVIIYNLQVPQVMAALWAARKRLPMVIEFEDDSFVDVRGNAWTPGIRAKWHHSRELEALNRASASICVSPHLQSRFPGGTPSLLLRGVISDEMVAHAERSHPAQRKNIVAFSGTFTGSKGLAPLIEAWKTLEPPGWELHIAGDGEIANELRALAANTASIKFRGLLNRHENAAFLAECRIGINPHDLSMTPGNVFAFKIIEYLAAGLHVISTPMGPLESQLEAGITYIPNNTPSDVASGLSAVIGNGTYGKLAAAAAVGLYGSNAVAAAMDDLLVRVVKQGVA